MAISLVMTSLSSSSGGDGDAKSKAEGPSTLPADEDPFSLDIPTMSPTTTESSEDGDVKFDAEGPSMMPANEDSYSQATPTMPPSILPSSTETSTNYPWTNAPISSNSQCPDEEAAFRLCIRKLCRDTSGCEQCLVDKIDSFTDDNCAEFSDALCPTIANECPCNGCKKESELWLQCLFSDRCPFSCGDMFDSDSTKIVTRYFMHFLSMDEFVCIGPIILGITATAKCGEGSDINVVGKSPDISCEKTSKNVLECTSTESVFNGGDLAGGFSVGALVNFTCAGSSLEALEATGTVSPYSVTCIGLKDKSESFQFAAGNTTTSLQMGYGCGDNLVKSHSNCSGVIDPVFGYCKGSESCSNTCALDRPCGCTFTVGAVSVTADRACC